MTIEDIKERYEKSVDAFVTVREEKRLAALAYTKALILQQHPTAVQVLVTSSDQDDHGYCLTGVVLADGSTLEADAEDELEEIWAPLSDLDWSAELDEGITLADIEEN